MLVIETARYHAILGIVVTLAYVSLSAYVLHFCRLLANPSRRSLLKEAPAKIRAWAHTLFARAEGGMELEARRLITRGRVRCMQSYAVPFMHFFAFVMVINVLSPTLELLGLRQGADATNSGFNVLTLLDTLWHLVMCLAFVAFPRLVTSRTIDASYVLLSAWWAFRVFVLIEPGDIMALLPLTLVQRAILGLITCNAWVTSSCNLTIMIFQCLAHYWHSASVAEGTVRQEQVSNLMMIDAVGTAFIAFALIFVEQGVWTVSRYFLQVNTSSKTEVTVLRLLSALCDAVVTLGSDLQIVSRAPKLANLLLVGNSARALEGSNFLDLMLETDRVRFRQFLAQAPDPVDSCNEPAPAQALNVNLKDSGGIGVKVQLFHSHFQDNYGQVGHLIGICEVGDCGGGPVDGNASGGGMRCIVEQQTQQGRASTGPESVDSASTRRGNMDFDSDSDLAGDSASALGAGAQHPGGHPGGYPGPRSASPSLRYSPQERLLRRSALQPQEVSVAFDSLRFIIWQQENPTPVINASLLERESLQQWVTEWSSCRLWMQDLLNAALRPVHAASWPSRAGPPSSLSFHVAFGGCCALPPDLLSRGTAAGPSGGPGEEPADRRMGSGADAAGAVAPPTRLTVNRIRLVQRPPPSSSGRPFSSELRGRSRRHHHASVQPHASPQATSIGAPAMTEVVPARASSSTSSCVRL